MCGMFGNLMVIHLFYLFLSFFFFPGATQPIVGVYIHLVKIILHC